MQTTLLRFPLMSTLVVFTALLILGAAIPAHAADGDPTLWQGFWAAVEAPLVSVVMAVLAWLGTIVSLRLRAFLGERAASAVMQVYDSIIAQGVGYLRNGLGDLAGKPAAPLPVSHPAVTLAVDYIRDSYPESRSIEPNDGKLAEDLIAGLGRVLAGAGRP